LALAAPLGWQGRSAEARCILRGFLAAVALLSGICALTIGLYCVAYFRYEVDFLPTLVLLAVVGILGLEHALAPTSESGLVGRPVWRGVVRWGWGLLLGFSVAFNLLASAERYAEECDNLGAALRQAGRVQEAIGRFEQALRVKPDFAEAHNNLGIALVQAGRVQEAIEHLEQALRIKPDFAEAHNDLALALKKAGNLKDAIGHFEQALRIQPDEAETHYNMALALEQAGNLKDAIGHFEQAVRINPDFAEAHNSLGGVLGQVGRVQEAIEHLEQALRLKPGFAKAHYNLGLAFVRSGRLQDAMGHWEQAVLLNPDYAEAHYNLAVVLLRQGNVREAVRQYEQVMRIKPDSAEVENNLAWLLATSTPADGGDPVRAVALAQHACELTGNRVAGHVDTLAAAYAAAGQFSEAIATAQKAIELTRSAGQPELVREIEARLQLYRDGRPYRQSAEGTGIHNP
jgi:tetratricopeptide (TPR) repeat protein